VTEPSITLLQLMIKAFPALLMMVGVHVRALVGFELQTSHLDVPAGYEFAERRGVLASRLLSVAHQTAGMA